jgi:hypothetical protein
VSIIEGMCRRRKNCSAEESDMMRRIDPSCERVEERGVWEEV